MLTENKLIGLSWAVIDYDDVNARNRVGFWNLSHKQTMFGNADELVGFRLMPLEPQFRKPRRPNGSFKVVDMDRRLVAFKDESVGQGHRPGNGTSATAPPPPNRIPCTSTKPGETTPSSSKSRAPPASRAAPMSGTCR